MTRIRTKIQEYGNPPAAAVRLPLRRGATRSRKIVQFKHYCTDAPI